MKTSLTLNVKTSIIRLTMLLVLGFLLTGIPEASAAIAIRGTYTTGSSTNSNLTINKPSGVVAGDVMIVNIMKYGSATDPTLSGWTLIDGALLSGSSGGSSRHGSVLYRVVTGTEGANFTFALGTNSYAAGSIVAFSGVDVSGASPFDAAPGTISTPSGTATTLTVTSITTNTANAAVIMFGMNSNTTVRTFNSWTTANPGALTEIYDYLGATYEKVGAGWALKPTIGSTGASSLTLSGSASVGGILLALKPILPVPTITSFSPSGACPGTTGIVITGTNFTGATAVNFNGVTSTFAVDNATQITATVPLTATSGTISVVTPSGTATSASSFTVNPVPAAPVATSATSVTTTGFSANWNAASGATGYYLDVSTVNTFANRVIGYDNLNVSNVLTYPVIGLSYNTTYYYRIRAYNSSGCTSANSNTITIALTSYYPPVISSQPSSQTICEGNTATFTAQSTGGSPAPTAKWQISIGGGSFNNLTAAPPYSSSVSTVLGVTTATLTITATPYSYDGNSYRVIFNNTSGNAISDGALLTVNPSTAGGSVTGGSSPICLGSSTGTLSLSGHTGTIIKWQKRLNAGTWSDITNTALTYSETPLSAGTWEYRAEVQSGVCAAATSVAQTIIVNPRPSSVISGTAAVCSGQSATLSIALTGTAPWSLTYTDGTTPVNVSSIASSPYTFIVTPASAKTYTVTALSDAHCNAQSGDMTGSAAITVNTACQVVTLSQPAQLSAVISGTTTISCGNPATITVTFTGGTAPYTAIYNSVSHTSASPVTFNVSPAADSTYDGTNITITDAHGCSGSATGSAVITVTPLPAPVATDAGNVTTTGFDANWNTSSGATGYLLDVSTSNTFASFVGVYHDLDVLTQIPYPVTGLTSGITYYYRLRAYNAICTSDYSNTKSVTTSSLTIGAPTVTGAPFTVDCSTSASGSISFTHGSFNGGNVFTAQLSDNTGNFASPVSIGTGSSSPISITIPANTPSGSNSYKIRVVSSSPVVTGSVSSTFSITNNPCIPIYRSNQTGNWNVPGTWQVSTDGGVSWPVSTSTTPNSSDGAISVRTGDTVTITDVVTVDQLTVEAGGTLNNAYNSSFDFYLKLANGTGDDLTVNGTLIANDYIENNTGATIIFGANSHYIHNLVLSKKGPRQVASTTEIPTATWNISSTCEIQAVIYVPVDGIGQEFGNLTWNYIYQPYDIDLSGVITEVKGNFTIISTGSGAKLQSYPTAGRATLHVGGNLDIQTGSILELGTLQNLTVSGNTSLADAEECLILRSAADGTASFKDNGTISGTGTAAVERYLTPYINQDPSDLRYHFLSSPVVNQPIQNEFVSLPNTTDDFYSWSEPEDMWINTKTGTYPDYTWNTEFESNFIQGKGYLVAYPSPAVIKTFRGKPYSSNSGLSITCPYQPSAAANPGWNLVGNPFPSAIDWDYLADDYNGLMGSGMDKAVYFYENATPTYLSYVPLTGGTGGATQYIPAMQGFMVHSNASTNNQFIINNASRTHTGQGVYYKSSATLSENVLNLKVEGNSYADYARVCFYGPATANFDGDYDAFKLASFNGNVPQLYSVTPDNTKVAINTLPLAEMYGTVPMGFVFGLPGTYTITADGIGSFPASMYIKLEDTKTGTIQKLNDNPAYSFTAVTGDNANRFLLHFSDATSVENPENTSGFTVYNDNGIVNVISMKAVTGQVKVYDMAGRTVATAALVPNQATRIDMHGQSGVYVVSVIHNKGTSNSKLVIK